MEVMEFIAHYAWSVFYGGTLSILTKGKMQPWNSWKWWAYVIPMVLLVAISKAYGAK